MDFRLQKAKSVGRFDMVTRTRNPILVKKAFKDHYEARFNKPTKARLKLNFSFPNRLSTDQVADLERHVSHDEIRLAVWVVEDSFSKVVTKILASRLAMVIAGLVSNTQSAFVAGRQILDGFDLVFVGTSCLTSLRLLDSVRLGVLGLEVPKGVLKVMESIRSNFFKGASMLEKKISWIAWDKVLASKKKGGLGVSSYFALNRALLLKWVWRFVLHRRFFVFWKETWIGDIPLCELCPRLFALILLLNICVAAKMAGPLDTSFRRSVRGGVEQQEFSDLSSFLNSVVLSTSNDRWRLCIVFALVGGRFPALAFRSQNGHDVVLSIRIPGFS
ncbi:hypothetical protein Tco_0664694 [Tanacetum coccineum]